jgi:hypothetical protein
VPVGNIIFPLDETLLSADATVLFKKGNPLLDRFDILMKGCWEAVCWNDTGQNCNIELL